MDMLTLVNKVLDDDPIRDMANRVFRQLGEVQAVPTKWIKFKKKT